MANSLEHYSQLLTAIKARIRQGQIKATLSANAELIQMYWDVGSMVAERQREEGWGSAIIPRLAQDIRNELPEIKGFSERNIGRMIAFYRHYPNAGPILPQPVAKIGGAEDSPQAAAQMAGSRLAWQIPWGHNIHLITRSHAPAWECICQVGVSQMGRSRYKFIDSTLPHFMTCTVLHWIPVFTRPATVDIVLESLRFLMKDGLKVYAYVILENHLHLVAQSNDLRRDMARFKSHTSKQLLAYLSEHNARQILDQLAFYKKAHKDDRAYQFWQEGVHPEWIQDEEMMRQKIQYIHNNPVERGYVDNAEHWRYSSARNYEGQKGLLEVARQW